MRKIINNKLFEWDDEKAKINKMKHGISFETAAMVFRDENRIEEYDDSHSSSEDRWKTIGRVKDILFVVYTERIGTRLISARKATLYERSLYYDSQEMD
ncbi:MAG: BrnT family toxin [Selenomonadaceae bacterium]|nr:BrnT family toxin [Selenomonadaceae bacterium]MBO6305062.1 BrnT family toxin [Selenomonadaceae bacterium]MBP3721999.1 BrnT family toxin [Selenomonadaceae bacterium]